MIKMTMYIYAYHDNQKKRKNVINNNISNIIRMLSLEISVNNEEMINACDA